MFHRIAMTTCMIACITACSVADEAEDVRADSQRSNIPDPVHNSRNSLDWPGVYTGTLPCADCPGIDISITLLEDGTFQRSLKYLERDQRARHDQGGFQWNEAGGVITLLVDGEPEQSYKVGEGVLFHLDQAGNVISGELAVHYRLTMMSADPDLQDREWVLVELRGQPVTTEHPPSLRFDRATGRLSGSDGCNRIMGAYRLAAMQGLQIKENLASTMMACPDMETPRQFAAALKQVDHYSIAGGELSLNRARMAPLLRFRLAMAEE